MTDLAHSEPDVAETNSNPPPTWRRWFQFRLRTVFWGMILVAVFLAGRASNQMALPLKLGGVWRLELNGHKRAAKLLEMGDGQFRVMAGGVFDGVYELQGDRLVIVQPADDRMVGLTWRWTGSQLLLIDEPPSHPTGASYVGAVLVRPEEP